MAWSLDQVFVLGGGSIVLPLQRVGPAGLRGGGGLCPGTFCKSQGGSGCDAFCAVLRCYTLSVGARGCLPGCVWHGAIFVCAFAEGVEGIRCRLTVFANVRVRVCHLGLAVRPHHPFKDATTQSLATVAMGTPSWLCPSEQMAIGIKSSETGVSPPSTTTAHKRTPGSMAPVPPRLRAGAAPVAWQAVPGMRCLACGGTHSQTAGREGHLPPRLFSVIPDVRLTVSGCDPFIPSLPSFSSSHQRSSSLLAGIFLASESVRPSCFFFFFIILTPAPFFTFPHVAPVPTQMHGTMALVWSSLPPPLPFLFPSPPLPMPVPAPAQALTGWHRANLPPPSLSFVAHLALALPPVSTFPSLSLSPVPFIQFSQPLPLH